MNHARIEQQGAPEEILERPRTPFVAELRAGPQRVRRHGGGTSPTCSQVETTAGSFLVPRPRGVASPAGHEVSRSRCGPSCSPTCRRGAARQPADGALPRGGVSSARCAATIFERRDGEVLKLDQFGAHARAHRAEGRRLQLGWRVEDTVLHTRAAAADEHDPRPLARAATGWPLPAAAVDAGRGRGADRAAWSGCPSGAAAPSRRRARSTFDNYAQVLRQPDLHQARRRRPCSRPPLMVVTLPLGYCIAYFLVMKVREPALAAARCSWPSSSRSGPRR